MNPDNFKLFHTLTRHNDEEHGEWDGLRGRLTWEMLQQCGFPEPADDVLILRCGPKGMNETVSAIMNANGYIDIGDQK